MTSRDLWLGTRLFSVYYRKTDKGNLFPLRFIPCLQALSILLYAPSPGHVRFTSQATRRAGHSGRERDDTDHLDHDTRLRHGPRHEPNQGCG